jgi:hypothetical protein
VVGINNPNGQSPITNDSQKPITTSQDLNYLENEHELYAAVRPTRPPEVAASGSTKTRKSIEKPYKKNTKSENPTKKRKQDHIITGGSSKSTAPINVSTQQTIMPESHPHNVIRNYQPMLPSVPNVDTQPSTLKVTRPKPVSVTDRINYDISADVLQKKADISLEDLLIVSPSLKRELNKTIKKKTAYKRLVQNTEITEPMSLAFAEDGDVDTTAIYSDIFIDDFRIRGILDTGSAKSVISKQLADKIGLKIDAPSEAIFTLGNGTKQAALGIIYDVELNLGGKLIVPTSLEVLPYCPTNLILGNNYLKRAKARISLEEKNIRIEYKGKKVYIPISFTKPPPREHVNVKTRNAKYTKITEEDVALIDGTVVTMKQEHDSDDDSDDDSIADDDDHYENDDAIPDSSDDDSAADLMILEDEYSEISEPLQFGIVNIVRDKYDDNSYKIVTSNFRGFYLPPHSNQEHSLDLNYLNLDPGIDNSLKLVCNITNKKLHNLNCTWNPTSSYLDHDGEKIRLILDNTTDDTIEFRPDEQVAELDVLFLNDIEQMETYKILPRRKSESELLVSTLDEHAEEMADSQLMKEFLKRTQDKLDTTSVPPPVLKKFLNLIYTYDHLFDWDNNKIGNIDAMEHHIQLKPDAVPRRARPYRLSPLETRSLKEELDKLLRLGIIEKGGFSDWTSPIILIRKKDLSYRLVVDFRYLNSQSETTNYPLNNIDELLDSLNKGYWMSTFDLRNGFFQANISKASQHLTTIVCPLGDFYFKKLPMGVKSSPSFFSRAMEKVFHELIGLCCIIYLDDVTTYTNEQDPHKHLNDLEKTFKCMDRHGLVLNPKKCNFFKDKILFLGFVVTRDNIEPNPATVEKVKDFPIPKKIKDVRSFLGLASYYRRFIPNFARIARPLHNLLKTETKSNWSDEATQAFVTLKECLTSEPILTKPDFNKPFIVISDAALSGLGNTLCQRDEQGRERVICYSSRSLRPAEKSYGISKLELLGVVWSLKLYRPYLLGSKFSVTVITDHSALKGLLKSKDASGIIGRWLETIAEFDFEIEYRPGKLNASADFLSRLGY